MCQYTHLVKCALKQSQPDILLGYYCYLNFGGRENLIDLDDIAIR